MEKDEFDDFYEDMFLDAEGNRLARSWLFGQARNHLGNYSAEDNKARRVIRGSIDDRDRVLCWLEMLRRDTLFEDMALAYGRCAGTYHNEFKDTTAAAQNMPCLQEEIQWPDAAERAAHCTFLQTWGHPDFPRVAYIADGTMVNMRNPAKVGKGQPEPHAPVHQANYSGNKGLGTSHIVYCNVRGKPIRVRRIL
ncbi:unnamed protein product [Ectocarpus sp. CCAP 1310/34]|nr:unnamed protein product [Ectocarpus sp. CCAP 1310/34]